MVNVRERRSTPSGAEREARKVFREAEAKEALSDYAKAQEAFYENRERLKAERLAREAKSRETDDLASKLAECAREARHQAALLPQGPVRDALLEKAKQYEAQIPNDSTYTTPVVQR
ncbi:MULTISPECIES: hypothetical protein [Bradyrhizobium]|uniref:hypothetical protein n=1 Tax=Bradyrhizobium pachyrhizi TaxID=280333 RepID=UPI000ABA0096|nr:hypothetical protein [Bradyrhizobium pachyrhizi]